jgi:hypothetical protein
VSARAGGRQPSAGADAPYESEVDQHGAVTLSFEQDVARLHVAMNQAAAVGRLEPGQALLDNSQRLLQGEAVLAFQPVGQRFTVDELHGEEMVAGFVANEVNWDDVRVNDLPRGGGFGTKTADEIAVAGQLGRKDLDGHLSVEQFVVPQVDVAHPAVADAADDAKMSQPLKRQLTARRANGSGRRRLGHAKGGRFRVANRPIFTTRGAALLGWPCFERDCLGRLAQGVGQASAVRETMCRIVPQGCLERPPDDFGNPPLARWGVHVRQNRYAR